MKNTFKLASYGIMMGAAITLLSGCASILSKRDYPVAFNSNPKGAKIEIVDKKENTVFSGSTPTVVTLRASSGFFQSGKYTIKANLEGYPPVERELKGHLDGWYIGNLLFGGLVGILIVDPATGAMWALPKEYTVEMNEPQISSIPQELQIVHLADVDEVIKSRMVRIN